MQAGIVENFENFVCSFIVKIGVKTLPAFSILVGEATMSYMLGHVVILPSPIGVELMEFPARMIYALKKRHKGCKPGAMLPCNDADRVQQAGPAGLYSRVQGPHYAGLLTLPGAAGKEDILRPTDEAWLGGRHCHRLDIAPCLPGSAKCISLYDST
ncbi:MAG: hypothetical protein AB1351_06285 [Thermoproteota archaeon]